jgi:hypothetical protein
MNKKTIISIVLILMAFAIILGCWYRQESKAEKPVAVETVVLSWYEDIDYKHLETVEEVETEIEQIFKYYDRLIINLDETFEEETEEYKRANLLIEGELNRIMNIYKKYEIRIVEIYTIEAEKQFWEPKRAQYPEATQVWLYMKENFDWSDEVCAGIMGNIMAEIAGGTLDFSKWNSDDGPYGLCQWLGGRKKQIKKIYGNQPTIDQQLEFMYDELYGTDGVTQQVKDYERRKILNAKSAEKAARYFCIWFERPTSKKTGARENYAKMAYEYFTSEGA